MCWHLKKQEMPWIFHQSILQLRPTYFTLSNPEVATHILFGAFSKFDYPCFHIVPECLTYFFLMLVVMFCPNRGSSKQFHGFSFFLLNQMQVQHLRKGAVYAPLNLWWTFVLYLSCLWALVIYVWNHLLVLCITRSYFSSKAEQKDALNNILLSAYLHLQSEGFLSTWTNSFVGPWDPSQGEHNPGNNYMQCLLNVYLFFFHLKFGLGWCIPHDFVILIDEKIKLWLFLPGCHSSVSESAQPAVNKLRGWLWLIFFFIVMS